MMVKEGKKVKPGLCDPKNVGLDATAGDKDSGSRPGSNIRSCKEYVSPEAKMGGDNQNDADDAKEAKGSRGSGSK